MSSKRRLGSEAEEEGPAVKSKFVKPKLDSRLGREFFTAPCSALAQALVGCTLCRQSGDTTLRVRIVETEAYPGNSEQGDPASHSFVRRTERNAAMFMQPGTVYVYNIYGMYQCFNISSGGEGAAVLVRAGEPLQGSKTMLAARQARRKPVAKPLRDTELCSGPSKLCQALGITRKLDQADLVESEEVWLEAGEPPALLVTTTRVGISGAGPQAAARPLRWYELGNLHVSVKDKKAESKAQ